MYTARFGLMALVLVLFAGTANGQAPVSTEPAPAAQRQAQDAPAAAPNAPNLPPVAPKAVKEMQDMNPAPALWVLYETTTWITLFAVLVLFVLVSVGLIRWYQRHAAPADPVQVAMSDPWVRANLGRLKAAGGGTAEEPTPPEKEA